MIQEEVQPAQGKLTPIPLWRRAVALGFALLATGLIIAFRGSLAQFATYGYAGVFAMSLLSNATIVLPVPGTLSVFAAGSALNPWLVGLVAGVAEPLGELTGYLAGYAGQAVVQNQEMYVKLIKRMEGHNYFSGYLTIFVLSAIPNPLFDLAGIAAGALRLPVAGFLISCWLGKTLKATAVALAGAYSVGFVESLLLT